MPRPAAARALLALAAAVLLAAPRAATAVDCALDMPFSPTSQVGLGGMFRAGIQQATIDPSASGPIRGVATAMFSRDDGCVGKMRQWVQKGATVSDTVVSEPVVAANTDLAKAVLGATVAVSPTKPLTLDKIPAGIKAMGISVIVEATAAAETTGAAPGSSFLVANPVGIGIQILSGTATYTYPDGNGGMNTNLFDVSQLPFTGKGCRLQARGASKDLILDCSELDTITPEISLPEGPSINLTLLSAPAPNAWTASAALRGATAAGQKKSAAAAAAAAPGADGGDAGGEAGLVYGEEVAPVDVSALPPMSAAIVPKANVTAPLRLSLPGPVLPRSAAAAPAVGGRRRLAAA